MCTRRRTPRKHSAARDVYRSSTRQTLTPLRQSAISAVERSPDEEEHCVAPAEHHPERVKHYDETAVHPARTAKRTPCGVERSGRSVESHAEILVGEARVLGPVSVYPVR
jgi:hypothetical protein